MRRQAGLVDDTWDPGDVVPLRWDRAVWEEGDVEGAPIVFYFEFAADGGVLRQVELAGSGEIPIAAASRREIWEAQGGKHQAETPQLAAYRAQFGGLAEGSRHDWDDDYPGESISHEEFERVWVAARNHLVSGAEPGSRP
jgi:hypothetical protein